MNKAALLAAAAAMASATPAFAQVGGYVGVDYTATEFQLFGKEDLEGRQAEFSLGFAGERWGAQIEGGYGNVAYEFIDNDITTFAGHFWYSGENWRLGGVIARTADDYFGLTEWAYGIEGTYDITPNAVVSVSYTRGDNDEGYYESTDLDFALNYYVTPNLRLGALVGAGEYDYGPMLDSRSLGLNVEYQPFAAPVSFTLGWASYDLQDDPMESESLSFGVRWNFGAATLRERDNITPFNAAMGYDARATGAN